MPSKDPALKLLQKRRRRYYTKQRIAEHYGSACSDCGVTHPHMSFFDLHHVDPSSKEVRTSRILTWSWSRVLEELKKCVFLCPSCHRIRHLELGDFADMNFYKEEVDAYYRKD